MNNKFNHHIIGISTTRPELLYKQIYSFIENARKFKQLHRIKLTFVVVDDTENKEDRFKTQIHKVQDFISSNKALNQIQIIYWSYESQVKFFTGFGKYLKEKSDNLEQVLYFFIKDFYSTKLGGIRGVQNKTDLLMRLYDAEDNAILTRVDDDIYPLSMVINENTVDIDYCDDFFGTREKNLIEILQNHFIGAMYTGDSPSHIADLADSMKVIYNFFKYSENISDENTNWAPIARKVCCCASDHLNDPLALIDTPVIPQNSSYKDVLKIISQLIPVIIHGNCRFHFTDGNQLKADNKYGEREFVPGGCVSYLSSDLSIPPSFPFGTQDVLTSYFIAAKYGRIFGDMGMLHVKTFSNRRTIFDDFSTKTKHDIQTTYQIFKLISAEKKNEFVHEQIRSIEDAFLNYAKQRIEETLENNQKLRALLQKKQAWWNNEQARQYIEKLVHFSDLIEEHKNILQINVNFSDLNKSNANIKRLYNTYKQNIQFWYHLIKELKIYYISLSR